MIWEFCFLTVLANIMRYELWQEPARAGHPFFTLIRIAMISQSEPVYEEAGEGSPSCPRGHLLHATCVRVRCGVGQCQGRRRARRLFQRGDRQGRHVASDALHTVAVLQSWKTTCQDWSARGPHERASSRPTFHRRRHSRNGRGTQPSNQEGSRPKRAHRVCQRTTMSKSHCSELNLL